MRFVTQIKKWISDNPEMAHRVGKNTLWLASGQITARLIRITLIVYAARILGPASWGAFSYVMSLVAFMTIVSDFGMGAVVTRESAKNEQINNQHFSTAFVIRLGLLLLGSAFLIFGANYITKIAEAQALIPLISLVLIFDSLRNFGFALSRAKEKMSWESANEIITNTFITIFGFLLLFNSPTSQSLTIGYIIGTGLGFLAITWKLWPYFQTLFHNFNLALIKSILSTAWPVALAGSLGAIMINTDIIMLGWMRSPEELGFYAAAQRPVQLLYIFPTLFATSLFPSLTKLASQSKEKFKEILRTAVQISLLTAVPIAIIGVLFSGQIINLLFGPAYQNSAPLFQMLLATILIIFPSAIINNAIFASNQQKNFIVFSALGTLGNILFNFILIPPLGALGCALATVITQLIANGFMWRKMLQLLK